LNNRVMALSSMLSALRELILDDTLAEGDSRDRKAALADRFTDLTECEIDDLASIPPDRLTVYTNLVFAGERGLLQWAYPMSLAAIARLQKQRGDAREPRDLLFDLTRDLQRFRPWRSSSTRELAGHFRAFVAERLTELLDDWPGMIDVVEYELDDLNVFYANDFPGGQIDVGALSKLSVESLMSMEIARPPYVRPQRFGCDVLKLAEHFRDRDELPATLPISSITYAVCTRPTSNLMPTWIRLSEQTHSALAALPGGEFRTVNDLANAFLSVDGHEPYADESAAFSDFFGHFATWANLSVIMTRPA
jgi:hypothetical protein